MVAIGVGCGVNRLLEVGVVQSSCLGLDMETVWSVWEIEIWPTKQVRHSYLYRILESFLARLTKAILWLSA